MTAIMHPEDACDDCDRPYGIWWTDHAVWNEAIGGDAAREAGGFLCASCFIVRATAAGIASRWKVTPDDPPPDSGSTPEQGSTR